MLSIRLSTTKCSSQEACLSGDKKKKKRMIPDSDNAIKYKGWHVRRCQGGLFAKWVIREGDIGAKCSKQRDS